MKIIRKILENTKIPLDIWFFFLFLFTFSLTLRKVMLHFPIQGTFNEYSGIYIYISDILLGVTIALWLFTILCNTKHYSSISNLWITWLKHKLSPTSRGFFKSYYLLIPLFLVAWSFLSIAWSDNQTIALFRSIKILESYLLYSYVIFRFIPQMFHTCPVECSTWNIFYGVEHSASNKKLITLNCSTWNISFLIIIFVGLIQSIIGILQVATQQSIHLAFLGESLIGQNIPGVAKIVFHGERYIRAYGLFPHPNILGGYLLLSIILTLLYLRMFHVEHPSQNRIFITRLIYSSLIIQTIALLFSFSKSAILGLIISLIYIYVPRHTNYSTPAPLNQNVPRGTFWDFTGWSNSRLRIIILSILIIISLGLIANQDLSRNLEGSFQERLTYLDVSRGTILASPILGTGIGQSVWNMQDYSPVPLEAWQLQPVHNVFLLIWSELGIVGLGLFGYWLYSLFTAKAILCNDYNVLSMRTSLRYFKGILLGFIFIMLFDHYFWDIQQGSLMLWMTMGFIAGLNKRW